MGVIISKKLCSLQCYPTLWSRYALAVLESKCNQSLLEYTWLL